MHRSNKLPIQFLNNRKYEVLSLFLKEYRRIMQIAINHIWNIKSIDLNIQNDIFNLPKYFDYKFLKDETTLSARVLRRIVDQSRDIISGSIGKRKNLLYKRDFLLSKGEDNTSKRVVYFNKQLENCKLSKPEINDNLPAKLDSNCIDFVFYNKYNPTKRKSKKSLKTKSSKFYKLTYKSKSNYKRNPKRTNKAKYFSCFIRIKCTGFSHIKIPIQLSTPFFLRKEKGWELLNGIELLENQVILVQEKETPKKKTEGITLGIDTGINSVYTTSRNESSKKCIHGHDLPSIQHKLEKKKYGSKSFQRTVEHRKNYTNWTINQVDFSGVKQVNLEKINTHTSETSRYLSHFAHRVIDNKFRDKLEEVGVRLLYRSSAYKSQRCSGCGMVCKSNRKGKKYDCKHCGLALDADYNAAINNSIDLPDIPYEVTLLRLNIQGFFWKKEGIFNFDNQELTVLDTKKT